MTHSNTLIPPLASGPGEKLLSFSKILHYEKQRWGSGGEALLWGMKYKLEPEGLIISAPPSYQPWMTSRGAGVCKQLFTLTWPRLEAGHTLWRSQNIGQGCVGSLQVAILRLRSYSDRDHHCSNTTLALMKLGMYNTRAFVWG